MSTVKSQQESGTCDLASLLNSIATELSVVDDRLKSELRHKDPFIDELAQRSFRLGGKRLRPALLLLSAQAVGSINDAHRVLAAVVEMIHTATLVHDDVLDEAVIRRHEDTVNARWNNQTSVLLGDYLFTHAFYLASTLETTFGCRTIGQATNLVCEGELLQTAASGNFDLSRSKYFRIIRAKTAALCACACQLGAHYAQGSKGQVEGFESFGRHLGSAFQIVDDLLDLEGHEQIVGKSLGTDLDHRKMTLPLIQLRDQLAPSECLELQEIFEGASPDRSALLLDWLERSGALQYTREVAEGHVQSAASQLTTLPDSQAKQTLVGLTDFVIQRDC